MKRMIGMITAAALLLGTVTFSGCSAEKKEKEVFSVEGLTCMVDLHLHIDGAISPESARKLAKMQDIDLPGSDEELLELLRVSDDCRDLNEFLEKFDFPCSLMQTKEGIAGAVTNLLEEQKDLGVMYVELRFAPQLHLTKGLTQDEVVRAAIDGMNAVSGIYASLTLCAMRGEGNEDANYETVDMVQKYLGKGVCALDLAGAEGLYPTKDYQELFAYARDKSVPFTVHAGEADGPQSVRDALSFGACRIGHGIRSCEDPALLKELAEKKIPLETCPTSNIKTAIYRDFSEFPYEELKKAGCVVTVNTDDPSVEGTDIKTEYDLMCAAFGLTKDDVKGLLMTAVSVSFADDALKAELSERIEKEFSE